MEPKIIDLGPLFLAGQPYYGSSEGGAFGQAWERFNAMHNQVPGRVEPKLYYGLEVYGPEFMSQQKWTYMPAVQVCDLTNLPGPLFGKVLPACRYAVFTAKGGLASIPDAFMYGYGTWIPSSPYDVAYPFDFELYDDERFHDDANSEIDIYIPIKEKGA